MTGRDDMQDPVLEGMIIFRWILKYTFVKDVGWTKPDSG